MTDTEAVVSVRDRGEGVPAAEQHRVFERFHRVEGGLTRTTGGTGLGLYIARHLVESMDGRIWLRSEPGVGSTFSFSLPLAAANSAEDVAMALEESRRCTLAARRSLQLSPSSASPGARPLLDVARRVAGVTGGLRGAVAGGSPAVHHRVEAGAGRPRGRPRPSGSRPRGGRSRSPGRSTPQTCTGARAPPGESLVASAPWNDTVSVKAVRAATTASCRLFCACASWAGPIALMSCCAPEASSPSPQADRARAADRAIASTVVRPRNMPGISAGHGPEQRGAPREGV